MKVCTACKTQKFNNEFYQYADRSTFAQCKECTKAKNLARYVKRPQKAISCKCGETDPLKFHENTRASHGHASKCKACVKIARDKKTAMERLKKTKAYKLEQVRKKLDDYWKSNCVA